MTAVENRAAALRALQDAAYLVGEYVLRHVNGSDTGIASDWRKRTVMEMPEKLSAMCAEFESATEGE